MSIGKALSPVLPGKRPVLNLEGNGVPHAFQKSKKLPALMRREKQLEQRLCRIEHRKHGKMLSSAFQKITKKTRITRRNTDQKHL